MKCTNGALSIGERPDGHDWVLVHRHDKADGDRLVDSEFLWACPCDAFKWTSYAEWEKGREIAEPAKP